MLAAASMVVPTHERVTALDRLGDEIAELSAHLDAATARLLALIREFDARGGWNTGFRSCAAWLTWRVGLDRGAARERVRVARALGTLPRLAEALARGELSYSKVRALTRVATPETETRLLAVGRAGTAEHVERIVRGWRRVDQRAEARESRRRHASRGLYVRQDEDGMVMVRGRLEPEVGALLMQALAAARTVLYQRARAGAAGAPPAGPAGDPPTPAQQRADALALARGSDRARAIGPGRRDTRSRGNVSPACVRREPGGDAPRRRGARRGDRGADPNDSTGFTARAPASGRRLLLPGLRGARRAGASSPALGPRGPDDALQPRAPVSPAPPRGPRGRLPGRTWPERRPPVPAAGRPPVARRTAAGRGAGGSRADASATPRRAGPAVHGADRVPQLARGASGRSLGHQCPASSGKSTGLAKLAEPARGGPVYAGRAPSFSSSPIVPEALSPEPVRTSTVYSCGRTTPLARRRVRPAAAAAEVGST